jgi:acetyltransferase-like isoleucine patch superfamily enzyme
MDPIALLRQKLRQDTAFARKTKAIIRGAFSARIPANPVHRVLLAERSMRRLVLYELARGLYYQPLFELQCAQVGAGVRLELTPDSKLPAIDNCALVLGERVRINARTTFQGARNAPSKARIEIGSDTYLGSRVVLRAGLGIRIGHHVTIASNVILSSDPGHPLDAVRRRSEAAPLADLRQITIGDDVWIAEGATILGGVTIGDGAVIGAHAVVTKDVAPRTVVAGNPAKLVKSLEPEVLRSVS